jgi:hypothetical protein
VNQGADFTVAVCLESPGLAPVDGQPTAIDIRLAYGDGLTALSGSGDGVTDLDSNPDLNEGPELGGEDWDCNVLDEAVSAPKASSPAQVTCNTTDVRANDVSGDVIALATVRFTASGSGPQRLELVDVTGVLTFINELLCLDGTADCRSATVNVQ